MSGKRSWSIANKLTAAALLLAFLKFAIPQIRRAPKLPRPVAVSTPAEPVKPAPQAKNEPQPRQRAKSNTLGNKNVDGNNVVGNGNAVGNNDQANSSTNGPAVGSITQGPGSIAQIGVGNQATAGIKPPEELFTADVLVSVLGEGLFWAVGDRFVSPVDAALLLRIVDTQDRPASLSFISVELQAEDGHWVQLRRIPEQDNVIYLGPMKNAGHITIAPPDMVDVLASKGTLSPAEPVVGSMLMISLEQAFHVPEGDPTFRITLEDTQHRRTVIKQEIPRGAPHLPDLLGSIGTSSLFITPTRDMADLTKFPSRR